MSNHLVNHIKNPHLTSDNTLHVIGVCSNPVRYHSRYRLARAWMNEMEATPNVVPYVVEAAYGDRQHEITDANNPNHLQLRTKSSVWIKESLINLGVKRLLPLQWKYVAWVDMDLHFRNPHWAQEAIHQLQHFAVIQAWQHCTDLGPQGEVMQLHESFGSMHQRGAQKQRHSGETAYKHAHPGYAWCCTRAFWEATQGLPDFCLLGSADHHSAWACINGVHNTIPQAMHSSYHRKLKEWQCKAFAACDGQVGYVPGRIEHAYHGSKQNRQYQSRWSILKDNNYNPDTDVYHDEQGLIQTSNKSLDLAVHKYNLSRDEDAVSNG